MDLERYGGFSVDIPLENNMNNYGAEECDIFHTKKVATKLHEGSPMSPGVTHQDDAAVKAAARPKN